MKERVVHPERTQSEESRVALRGEVSVLSVDSAYHRAWTSSLSARSTGHTGSGEGWSPGPLLSDILALALGLTTPLLPVPSRNGSIQAPR